MKCACTIAESLRHWLEAPTPPGQRAKRDVSRVFPHEFELTSHRRGVSQFPYIRAEGGLLSLATIAALKTSEK
jgi:hypothetical protein